MPPGRRGRCAATAPASAGTTTGSESDVTATPDQGKTTGAAGDQGEIVGIAPAPDGPVSIIDYNERIPNNVGLATERRLQRAPQAWQPKFLGWSANLGPCRPTRHGYLRTAVAVRRT